VLLDSVVAAVDRLADERCTSRSGLVNQILAEYLSCPTPESRNRDIFSSMEKVFTGLDSFLFREQPSDSMVTIRSVLHYRYRPTVRYVLELYREPGPYLGELRITFRTQSSALLSLSEDFFRLWNALEVRSVAPLFPERIVPAAVEPGRYTRQLLCPGEEGGCSCEDLAQAIIGYIRALDAAMKEYFNGLNGEEDTERVIEADYRRRLKGRTVL
jgi:hypothetical protein